MLGEYRTLTRKKTTTWNVGVRGAGTCSEYDEVKCVLCVLALIYETTAYLCMYTLLQCGCHIPLLGCAVHEICMVSMQVWNIVLGKIMLCLLVRVLQKHVQQSYCRVWALSRWSATVYLYIVQCLFFNSSKQ